MMLKKLVAFVFTICTIHSLSQMATAQTKTLSQKDSIQVREIFFDGLHEKLMENYPQAAVSFKKVLETDPSNDAAMFELAGLSFAQNKPTEAERLIRNAVSIRPDNEW